MDEISTKRKVLLRILIWGTHLRKWDSPMWRTMRLSPDLMEHGCSINPSKINYRRYYIWRNSTIRHASGCQKPSKTKWPKSVTRTRSMNQTSWDTQSRRVLWITQERVMMVWTDYDLHKNRTGNDSVPTSIGKIGICLHLHSERTPQKSHLRGFLMRYCTILKKVKLNIHLLCSYSVK